MSVDRLNRRQFLQFSGLGLALTAGGRVMRVAAADQSDASMLSAYITVGRDGVITIGAPNPEVGQGVNTSLPMIIAEELDANWDEVKVVTTPIDAARFGAQFAGGSLSVPMRWDELRKVGSDGPGHVASSGVGRAGRANGSAQHAGFDGDSRSIWQESALRRAGRERVGFATA